MLDYCTGVTLVFGVLIALFYYCWPCFQYECNMSICVGKILSLGVHSSLMGGINGSTLQREGKGVDAPSKHSKANCILKYQRISSKMLQNWFCIRPGSRIRHTLKSISFRYWSDADPGNKLRCSLQPTVLDPPLRWSRTNEGRIA